MSRNRHYATPSGTRKVRIGAAYATRSHSENGRANVTSDEAAPPIEDAEPVQTLTALDEEVATPSTISRAVGELPRSAVILIITAAAVITGAGIKAANGI